MPGHALHGGGVEQVGGVTQGRRQCAVSFVGVEGQIKLRGVRTPVEAFDLQTGQLQGLRRSPALMVEHHLEQRAVTQLPIRCKGMHQLLERQILMRLRAQRRLFDLRQQILERQAALHLRVQHLGVDEEADQAFGFDPITVSHRHADANIRLAAVAMQQGLERGQQDHEQGHALALRQLFQAFGQFAANAQIQTRTAIALRCRARTIRGQWQNFAAIAQTLGPVRQLPLEFAGLHPLALPNRVIGVLDRQRREVGWLTTAVRGVEFDQIINHDLRRSTVANNVMLGQHQHMIIRCDLKQLDPQQRALLQVEQRGDFSVDQRFEASVVHWRVQYLRGQWQAQSGLGYLNRAIRAIDKHRAQHFMTFQQGIEAALQCRQIKVTAQTQRRRHMVSGAVRIELPEEPLTLLRE